MTDYLIIGPRPVGKGPIQRTYETRSLLNEATGVLDDLGIAYTIENVAMTNPFGDDYIAWELTVNGIPVTALGDPHP